MTLFLRTYGNQAVENETAAYDMHELSLNCESDMKKVD